jgi:hypothetical protein
MTQKLETLFSILRINAFEKWKVADWKTKRKITKELGEFEARMIIKEIEKEAKKIHEKK